MILSDKKDCPNLKFGYKFSKILISRFFYFSAKPIRAGHHPSGIPSGPVGIRGGGARPPVVKALTEADLLRSSHREQN